MTLDLLRVAEMARADALAIEGGRPGRQLMEAAGWAVAREADRSLPRGRIAVLCGPGNNGGDGFVAARLLARRGRAVRVALLGESDRLAGDAAWAAGMWRGPVRALDPACLDGCVGVVDALFGAGLSRPLDGVAGAVIERINALGLPVIAVDVPSGVDGDTGMVRGVAPAAIATVTFFRKKPGHCLMPGRALCGRIALADIGIPDAVLAVINPACAELGPPCLPRPAPEGHKYHRGHLVVAAGAEMRGAARLAARAGRRCGSGLVTLAGPAAALDGLRCGDPGLIVRDLADITALLADPRLNAWVVGPGLGVGAGALAIEVLAAGRCGVIDADALTPDLLREGALARAVLTPHDGECARLFGPLPGSRLDRARLGAARSGAVVVLKGPDTVVAAPDGRARIATNAPADLATAGSGDVLAGMIGGLLAQGMAPFDAACAGVWLHGEAGRAGGPGLIAEDLAEALPAIFAGLRRHAPC
jgi:NAD(P)H-hydrate epimerase